MQSSDTVFGYLEQFQRLLLGPFGLIALATAIAAIIFAIRFPVVRWGFVSALIFVSLFGTSEVGTGERWRQAYIYLPSPLSFFQAYSRELLLGIAGVLTVAGMASQREWRRKLVPLGLFCFLLLDFWMALRLMPEDGSRTRAVLSLLSYALIAGALVLGVGRWLQTSQDLYGLLRSLAWVAMLFVVSNIYYAIYNHAAVTGRFWGINGNPQGVGIDSAFFLVLVLMLSHHPRTPVAARSIYYLTAGFLIAFLLWSGSRGGVLIALVGLATFYRSRIGPMFIAAVTVGLALVTSLYLFPSALANVNRFADLTNSRTEPWQHLIEIFLTHPIAGALYGGSGYGESYFLASLAFYGIIGFIPAAGALVGFLAIALGTFRQRRWLQEDSLVADLLLAYSLMFLINGVTEAALLGVWNTMDLLLYLMFSVAAYLSDRIVFVREVSLGRVSEEDQSSLSPLLELGTLVG
jgi:hypothetical protein